MLAKGFGWGVLLLGLAIPTVRAQDVGEQDDLDAVDLLGEFDFGPPVKLPPANQVSPTSETSPKKWEIDGFFRTDLSYTFSGNPPGPSEPDYRGISKLRTTLQLELPVRMSSQWDGFVSGQAFHDFSYGLKGRRNFTAEALDLYEDQAELREAYISGSPGTGFDVKFGRQIVVWGAADYVRVVDILNPLDSREPGLVDIEDLRLPITMSRIDFSMNRWTLSGVAVHEVDFGRKPVFNSQFSPFPMAPPAEFEPSESLANTEVAISLTGSLPGLDLGLYWADYHDDAPHFETAGGMTKLKHSRLSMVGMSANGVSGDWGWKGEAALVNGLRFNNLPSDRLSRLDSLVGLEYSGITDTTIALEVVNRHLLDHSPVLQAAPDFQDKNSTQYVVSLRRSFLRDRLHLHSLSSFFGAGFEQGSFQRLSAEYQLRDGLALTLGVLFFHSGDSGGVPDTYEDNDILFMQAKYSF
jgi:hypothetical protein